MLTKWTESLADSSSDPVSIDLTNISSYVEVYEYDLFNRMVSSIASGNADLGLLELDSVHGRISERRGTAGEAGVCVHGQSAVGRLRAGNSGDWLKRDLCEQRAVLPRGER